MRSSQHIYVSNFSLLLTADCSLSATRAFYFSSLLFNFTLLYHCTAFSATATCNGHLPRPSATSHLHRQSAPGIQWATHRQSRQSPFSLCVFTLIYQTSPASPRPSPAICGPRCHAAGGGRPAQPCSSRAAHTCARVRVGKRVNTRRLVHRSNEAAHKRASEKEAGGGQGPHTSHPLMPRAAPHPHLTPHPSPRPYP